MINYLIVWSEYAKKPVDWANMNPRDRSDYRERVRRETFMGKTTYFHENIENYLLRQAKANTTFRIFSHFVLAYLIMNRCKIQIILVANTFLFTFPELLRYKRFSNHPNYKKLGRFWSWFYLLRVPVGN
jgi:hypothetical protein